MYPQEWMPSHSAGRGRTVGFCLPLLDTEGTGTHGAGYGDGNTDHHTVDFSSLVASYHHRWYKTDWVQIPPYEDMFLPVTPSASPLSGIPCYRVLALWSCNYFGSHGNNTRHKSLKQEPFVLNFLQISYIHSSHLCSHSNVPLSFPNVEPSIFLEH